MVASLDRQAIHQWRRTIGRALQVFMRNGPYDLTAQARQYDFFCHSIIPHLGPAPKTKHEARQWKSFMTDDGLCIELSWDWLENGQPPCIRFCMEPVGPQAGTSLDPQNQFESARCLETMRASCHGFDDTWLTSLSNQLLVFHSSSGKQGNDTHGSRMFLGYDLLGKDIRAKVYFWTKFKAVSTGKSDLVVVANAIANLPDLCPRAHSAFHKLKQFLSTSIGSASRMMAEAISVDCINPKRSRIKLYVRCADASFESIRNVVMLGGILNQDHMYAKGLDELRNFWDLLFGEQSEVLTLNSTGETSTAGIMYNFEFRPGDDMPVPKVYIPVRHYCTSDQQILDALQTFRCRYRGDNGEMQGYLGAIQQTFSRESLKKTTGVHTYVSCAFRTDGLKLAAYVNPQVEKLNDLSYLQTLC